MKKYVSVFVLLLLLTACSKDETPRDVELKPAEYSDLQGFDRDDMLGAYKAFLAGCEKIADQKGKWLSDAEIKIDRKDYVKVCDAARWILPSKFREFVKENFKPWLVTYQGEQNGKFTAYYEAEVRASYQRNDTYKYPIYGVPYDLVKINLKDFDETLPNKTLIGRVENGKLIPYYTRAEISQKGLHAPVVLWADSEIDIYIMQIQGSALAYLPDNSTIRIAFAESNGHPFKGIGSILLSKGLLEKNKASMGSIKKWLMENKGLATANMNENPRYIFHQLGNPEGPIGALGVPLTAGRSLAVDKSYIPLGALLWLETETPDGAELNKMVAAQDVGSAIKGAVRGDYFWGSGSDDVLEEAGKMNSVGKYYILIPNHKEDTNAKAYK